MEVVARFGDEGVAGAVVERLPGLAEGDPGGVELLVEAQGVGEAEAPAAGGAGDARGGGHPCAAELDRGGQGAVSSAEEVEGSQECAV